LPDEEVIGSGSDIIASRESPTGAELAYASNLDFQLTPLYRKLIEQLRVDYKPRPDNRTPEEKEEDHKRFIEDLNKLRAIREDNKRKAEEAHQRLEDLH